MGAGPLEAQQEARSLGSKLRVYGAPAVPSDWPRPSEGRVRGQEGARRSPPSPRGPLRSSHKGMGEGCGCLVAIPSLSHCRAPDQQNSPAHHPSEKLITESQDISTDKNLQGHLVPPGFREEEVTTQTEDLNLPLGIEKGKTHTYI